MTWDALRAVLRELMSADGICRKTIQDAEQGTMRYAQANRYAQRIGELLGEAIRVLGGLPEGVTLQEAQAVLLPALHQNYELAAEAAQAAQDTANAASQIGLKAAAPTRRPGRAEGIVREVAEKGYQKIRLSFEDQLVTYSQSAVDDAVAVNAYRQANAGLSPRILRSVRGGCCRWCEALAGVYEYNEGMPRDIYRRHENCRCTVEYLDAKRVQNIWTKKSRAVSREEAQKRIEAARRRETDGIQLTEAEKRDRIRTLRQTHDNLPRIPAGYEGNFEGFDELNLSGKEEALLRDLNAKSKAKSTEFAYVIPENEEARLCSNGLLNRIEIPAEAWTKEHLTIIHSHTNVTPLSWKDFQFLTQDNVDRIGNISINGDVYIAEIGNGYRPSLEEYELVTQDIADEANSIAATYPEFWDWDEQERSYIAIKEQAYLIARRFGWTIRGGRIDG